MTESGLYHSAVVWVFLFAALFWAYCIFWGARSARLNRTACDYFVAGRSLPVWVFVMAATASSFSGWLLVGQPALMMRDGLPAGYLSFCAIVVPLTGVLFLKRQWMLGKRYGFVTPGEMFAAYYRSDVVRVFTAIVALLFAIPLLGLLLDIAGFLVSVATVGALPRNVAMWAIPVVLLIHVTHGGLRAVAHVTTVQTLLIAAGTIILGLAALHLAGGFEALNMKLAQIAGTGSATWGTTLGHGGGDYNGLFAVSGVVQWTDGLGREMPAGGPWTGLMVMSFLILFMGIQASPVFSMWAFSSRSPKAFGHHHVWASACAAGVLLFVFVALQGLGGLVLGGNPAVAEQGLAVTGALSAMAAGEAGGLTAALIRLSGSNAPWLIGLLVLCVVVAVTACAGAYMATAGATATRDIYMRYFNPEASGALQKRFSRIIVLITTVMALLMATFVEQATHVLGILALSLALQLWPALLGTLWVPWFTRQGVVAGLIAGSAAVILADPLGQHLTRGTLPWGQWPWTIHAAVWGLVANLSVCIIGSAITQDREAMAHRTGFHDFLTGHASHATRRRWLTPLAWVATLVWVFFAIGPGIVMGNYIFGEPDAGHGAWDFAMPSIWAWQLLWWGAGVLLIWFLAFRMGLSTDPAREVMALVEDIGETVGPAPNRTGEPAARPPLGYEHGRA